MEVLFICNFYLNDHIYVSKTRIFIYIYIHAYVSFHLQILYDVHCFTTSCTPSNGAFCRRASSQLELPPDAGSTSGSPSPNKFLGRTRISRESLQPKWLQRPGFVYRISMDICVLVLQPWIFCCLVTQLFSVQHTFHVPELCDPRNLRRLSTHVSWWEGLLMFFVY